MLTNENALSSSDIDFVLFYKEVSMIIDRVGPETILAKDILKKNTMYKWQSAYNKTGPKPTKLKPLLQYDSGLNNWYDIADYYGGIIKQWIEYTFDLKHFKKEENALSNPTKSEVEAYIFNLCGVDGGIQEKRLVSNLSSLLCCISEETYEPTNEEVSLYIPIAKNRIQKLLNSNSLALNSGKYTINVDSVFLDLDFHLKAKKFEPYIIKEELRHKKRSHSKQYSEKITPDCIKRCHKRLNDTIEECIKDMNNSTSENGTAYYVSSMAEYLDFDTYNPIKEGELQ